jgi:transposase
VCGINHNVLKTKGDSMIFIGIDIASSKHDCVITDQHGTVLEEPFTIKNDYQGFALLTTRIEKHIGNHQVCVGLESTGHYGNNLISHLVEREYLVYVVNPLLTSIARKSTSVRKTKTDKTDSKAICTFLRTHFSTLTPYTLKSYHIMKLKSLSRLRLNLVKQQSLFKQEFTRLVSITFPELSGFTTTIHSRTNYTLFTEIGLPSDISNTRIDRLTRVLHIASKGHFSFEKAKELKELARNSIGTRDEYFNIQFQTTISSIRHFSEQIKLLDEEIKHIMDEHFTYIMTIPGVKYTTGAAIISEIGDITSFKSADSLVAYAGLDPSVYESGEYSANNNKMSKRGSKYLRNAIWTVATVIIHNDPVFSAYYTKKMKHGKHHNNALGHVSKKLTRVIFSLMKSPRPFITQH